jgi:predicted Zn-dependent protease
MLRLCRDEDEVASVLAHEIIHVQERHALQAIHTDRLTAALGMLTTQAVKTIGGVRGSMLTDALEGFVGDIASVLMKRGYSREMEREADEKAIVTLRRVGYDPIALSHVLKEMEVGKKSAGIGFLKTHPSPGDRALQIETKVGGTSVNAIPPERKRRFSSFLGRV